MDNKLSALSWHLVDLEKIDATACPCGQTRRAFTDVDGAPASLHLVDVSKDSVSHYHKIHSEIYYILEGSGTLELDGERVHVGPGSAVMIPPGVWHRPIGSFRILNVSLPVFDPADEIVEK